MSNLQKWWAGATAAVTGMILAVFVPAAAWAAENEVLFEAARRKSKGSGLFGFASLVCCLVVVGGIVLAVVLIAKRRRK
jgi:hypothetical protein